MSIKEGCNEIIKIYCLIAFFIGDFYVPFFKKDTFIIYAFHPVLYGNFGKNCLY